MRTFATFQTCQTTDETRCYRSFTTEAEARAYLDTVDQPNRIEEYEITEHSIDPEDDFDDGTDIELIRIIDIDCKQPDCEHCATLRGATA